MKREKFHVNIQLSTKVTKKITLSLIFFYKWRLREKYHEMIYDKKQIFKAVLRWCDGLSAGKLGG